MRRIAVLLALALLAAACSSSDSDSSTTAATTATTTATTTGGASTTGAVLAMSRVVFGDDGHVAVTNVGDESGTLEGWQRCQRPGYFAIGS
ncbi:MAG: hypothetical protein GY778_29045, partial [bacterium]|nr:hypothetical protein [bacterium]